MKESNRNEAQSGHLALKSSLVENNSLLAPFNTKDALAK